MLKTALLVAAIGLLLAEPMGAAQLQIDKDQAQVAKLAIPVDRVLSAKPKIWCACLEGNIPDFDRTLGVVAYQLSSRPNNRTAINLVCHALLYDNATGARGANICEDWVPVTR